jgi:hypothetical protein
MKNAGSTLVRIAVFLVLFLFILLISTAAVAADEFAVGAKRQVTFTEPVRVGDTLLPAGEYTVVHQMQGNEHMMVFTQRGAKKPAEARVRCTLVPLGAPAPQSGLGYAVNGAREMVLVQMVFKGDRAAHEF